MRKGIAFIISAPSGAGKTTLISKLRSEFSPAFSISCTTRPPRPGEINGREYFFLGKEQFEQMRDRGEFAEWALVHGNYYGTPLAPVLDRLNAGEDMVFDIDVQGAAQLHHMLPNAVFVFIMPPSLAELEKRLRGRGSDSNEVISIRLAKAAEEIRHAHWFDAVIVNDSLEKAYDKLRAVYLAARCRPSVDPGLASAIAGGAEYKDGGSR